MTQEDGLVLRIFVDSFGEGRLIAFFRIQWWNIDTRVGMANWREDGELALN